MKEKKMKIQAFVVVLLAAFAFGCKGKAPARKTGEGAQAEIVPYQESSAQGSRGARQAYVPSAGDLAAFLSAFPEIDSFPHQIEDAAPIGQPSLVKSDRSPDVELAARIMNWNPPPDQWRPAGWKWDSPQTEEPPSEETGPIGDADYTGEWEHGFYASGLIMQPDFIILIAAYSEAFSYAYSDPWIREDYQYRLVTISRDGRYIDSTILFNRYVEIYHPGTERGDAEVESTPTAAVFDSALSFRVGDAKYGIDEAGSIREVR